MTDYAKPVLVSTDWVSEHHAQPRVVLAEIDENAALYDEGHLPGAVRLHWKHDFQDPVRRDVISRAAFETLLGSLGIDNDTTIVLYGDKNNWFAAYAYWYLKLYGHADIRLLDGGRQKWVAEDRPLTRDTAKRSRCTYHATDINHSLRARRDDILRLVGTGSVNLVDVRSHQEYTGELTAPPGYEQEGAHRAGHIPGAVSIPWAQAVQDDGTFKNADELRTLYQERGVDQSRPTVTYCRIGERSAHTWFVLRELLGHPHVQNYDGSWTEWGNLIGAPIERGR